MRFESNCSNKVEIIFIYFDWSHPTPNDYNLLHKSSAMAPSILIFGCVRIFICICICICILSLYVCMYVFVSFLYWYVCACICICGAVQRISCDQCDPFAVGSLGGANVLLSGSQRTRFLASICICVCICICIQYCLYVCGTLYEANVLSSGSQWGKRGDVKWPQKMGQNWQETTNWWHWRKQRNLDCFWKKKKSSKRKKIRWFGMAQSP